MRRIKYFSFAVLLVFVLAAIPQPSLSAPNIEGGPGPADYVVKPQAALEINGSDVFVRFALKGSEQVVHGIVYGKPLGSTDVIALYLPGFRRDAERSVADFESRNRRPDFTLIVLDPPGKGLSTGPAQELENVLGDGSDPTTSYIRRYIEFAYATISAFYERGMPIRYVAGHSMGATTIMGLVTVADPALEAVRFYAPMAIAGYRLDSIRHGTFLNRFTKDPDKDVRLVKYFDVAAFAEKVRYPIVMINGMHDRVYNIRTMVRTAERLSSRLLAHVLVPDAGHRMCKDFALSFEARIRISEGADFETRSEIVYDNDYRHYSGGFRLTPADYAFELHYAFLDGSKVYVGSSVKSDAYSAGLLLLYLAIAAIALLALIYYGSGSVGIITILLGYRRFRAPDRFLVASFGKLFRFRIPIQILVAATFVILSRKRRWVPIVALLAAADAISATLMHSVVLPGPFLAALLARRIVSYTHRFRRVKRFDKTLARFLRRYF